MIITRIGRKTRKARRRTNEREAKHRMENGQVSKRRRDKRAWEMERVQTTRGTSHLRGRLLQDKHETDGEGPPTIPTLTIPLGFYTI